MDNTLQNHRTAKEHTGVQDTNGNWEKVAPKERLRNKPETIQSRGQKHSKSEIY